MRIYSGGSMFVMHFCFVCNMNRIGRVFVIYTLLVAATGAAELKSKVKDNKSDRSSDAKEGTTKATPINHVSAHAVYNNGMVGIASITGMDSRNGRLSSMSGVKIFPPLDGSMIKTDSKGNFIFKSTDGKMPSPITITKQGDGVSGTIRIMPGSVSVSSSAKSGSASAAVGPQIPDFNPWATSFMKPMLSDIFFPDPFASFPMIAAPAFRSRIPDSSFQGSLSRIPEPTFSRIPQPSFAHSRISDPWMEKDMYKQMLPRHNALRHDWYYPPFAPLFNYW